MYPLMALGNMIPKCEPVHTELWLGYFGMDFGAGVKGKCSAGSAAFELQNISLLGLVGCFNLL